MRYFARSLRVGNKGNVKLTVDALEFSRCKLSVDSPFYDSVKWVPCFSSVNHRLTVSRLLGKISDFLQHFKYKTPTTELYAANHDYCDSRHTYLDNRPSLERELRLSFRTQPNPNPAYSRVFRQQYRGATYPSFDGFRCLLPIPALASGVTRWRARAEAFFIEKKEKHGLELVALAFDKWLEEEIKYSTNYDSIDLAVTRLSATLQVKPAHYNTLVGRVIAKERTYSDYALQHIIIGYPEIYNSWHELTNAVNMYADWARFTFPSIKQKIETAIRQFLPKLSFTVSDNEDYCDLNVLLTRLIEFKLKIENLESLTLEPQPLPTKADGRRSKALYITTHNNERHLLLCASEWMDFRMFAEAVPRIAEDKTIREELDAIVMRLKMLESDLLTFKTGLKDLVYGLKLGGRFIEGECANCKGLETRLS
jgi:hypothetical protein